MAGSLKEIIFNSGEHFETELFNFLRNYSGRCIHKVKDEKNPYNYDFPFKYNNETMRIGYCAKPTPKEQFKRARKALTKERSKFGESDFNALRCVLYNESTGVKPKDGFVRNLFLSVVFKEFLFRNKAIKEKTDENSPHMSADDTECVWDRARDIVAFENGKFPDESLEYTVFRLLFLESGGQAAGSTRCIIFGDTFNDASEICESVKTKLQYDINFTSINNYKAIENDITKIVKAVDEHYFFGPFISSVGYDVTRICEIRALLRDSLIYNKKECFFKPVVETFVARKKVEIQQFLLTNYKNISQKKFYDNIAVLALNFSYPENSGKELSVDIFNKLTKEKNISQSDNYPDIWKDIVNKDILFTKNKDKIRFSDTLTRLFFVAYALSHESENNILFEKILRFSDINSDTSSDLKNQQYTTLVLLSSMLACFVSPDRIIRFYRYLVRHEHSFDVPLRYRKIAATAITSFALADTLLFDDVIKADILLQSFGHSCYHFQDKAWLLLKKYDYYTNVITEKYKSIINDPLTEQPFFFFRFHDVLYKTADTEFYTRVHLDVKSLFELRDQTWSADWTINLDALKKQCDEYFSGRNNDVLSFLNRFFYADNSSEGRYIWGLYAVQSFLYAINNLASKNCFSESWITNKHLIEIVVKTDFLTRFYNKIYCDKFYYNQQILNLSDMFLLCAPYRISCLGYFQRSKKFDIKGVYNKNNILFAEKIYQENNDRRDNVSLMDFYSTVLSNEHGRFRFLLIRFLYIFTNFFDDPDADDSSVEKEGIKKYVTDDELRKISDCDFLSYDNIDIINIHAHRYEPDKWFRVSREIKEKKRK